jgi:DNA (cytosine-5)-methyltransferase 1
MHQNEPRDLSREELARLGSFPDAFRFAGSWADSLGRIGNSVPPLLMRSIAAHVRALVS